MRKIFSKKVFNGHKSGYLKGGAAFACVNTWFAERSVGEN